MTRYKHLLEVSKYQHIALAMSLISDKDNPVLLAVAGAASPNTSIPVRIHATVSIHAGTTGRPSGY
jgi:hypothetical protein